MYENNRVHKCRAGVIEPRGFGEIALIGAYYPVVGVPN